LRKLQKAVGQGGLAMVYVSNYAKVADAFHKAQLVLNPKITHFRPILQKKGGPVEGAADYEI